MKGKVVATIVISLMLITGIAIANTRAIARGPPQQGPPGDNIVDVAIEINEETGEFSTLIAALLAADPAVIETLGGNGQFTVFAPTDAAFAELGLDEDNIGELDQDFLTDVLLYHVAYGRLYAEDVLEKEQINTLRRGRDGFLMQDGGVLTDNLGREANIIAIDVEAANGVIHVIDAVVLPYQP